MLAITTETGLYSQAAYTIRENTFDQTLEDEIDLFMSNEAEAEIAEQAEIDALINWQESREEMVARHDVSPSEFTEFAIKIPVAGQLKPFSFEGREYLKDIYDTGNRRVLMKCARQTEKSTTLGNKTLSYSAINMAFRTLFVSATAQQAQVFSVDRIKDPLELSPELKQLTDTKLNQNVFFKQFRNRSQIRIRYAFLSADRCLHGNSLVQLADGSRLTIKEMAEIGGSFNVISSTQDGTPFVAEATDIHCSGMKHIVRVKTDYPVDLLCSYDHPLLTGRGWIKAYQLEPTDFIAAPHVQHLFEDEEVSIGEDWAWLIGAMVSEGECSSKKSVRFTNSDTDFLDEFEERANNVELRLGERVLDKREDNKPCWSIGIYSDTKGPGIDGAKRTLWELGEFGQKSYDKHVPYSIWKATVSEKAAFLWALFNGDGWRCEDNGGGARAGYSSASKKLIEDIACLLWSLGIRCSISKKKKSTKNAKGSWTINLSKNPTAKLIDLIGHFRDCKIEPTRAKDDTDRIPLTYTQLRERLKNKHNLNTHSAWIKHKIQLRPGNVKDSVGRRVLRKIGSKLGDDKLLRMTSSDKSWVRVRNVTNEGIDNVYDLTVEESGCFMANGLIVHNTRGIPADMINIDEIQDIITDNIPVIEQCASHSYWKIFCYSGTPKSLDNTIEVYWADFSTQNEWAVPCERHGVPRDPSTWHWNILGSRNIGKNGLICAKCGNTISAGHPNAMWVSMQPVTPNNVNRVTFEGYRIPQIMVPWVDWGEILTAKERYPTVQFNNEVLGLSYDSGARPLTRAQVKAICRKDIHFVDVEENARKCNGHVFAGLDWGCHDDKTRILTNSGFKYFKDLSDEDLVAQFDKNTRRMTFVEPEVRTVRDWNGPLYHTTGKGIDMMLTGTHRMLFQDRSREWKVDSMSNFAGRSSTNIRGYVKWEGEELESFTLPGLPKSPGYSGSEDLVIDGDLWLELLGYFVSEAGLCYNNGRPSCVKMSQRAVNHDYSRVQRMRECLELSGLNFSEFPNKKTLDFNWTIYGKQFWYWWSQNIGTYVDNVRVPREFLNVSERQLKILFDAMVFGDGSVDKRERNHNGSYGSTSLGLCEDFQEICIRLGLKSSCRLHKKAEGNRKTRYRVSWSRKRDLNLNKEAMKRIQRVPYEGKVYCCKVPSGFIITERNGCIAYQGNTGEASSFTVLTLGGYMPHGLQIFFMHRFTGDDLEPQIQLDKIARLLVRVNFTLIGSDYGGGFDRNDWLMRNFGPQRLFKFAYSAQPKRKVKWQPELGRFILHRTEVMSDIFNAMKAKKIWLPNWEEMATPYGEDLLNIFSEFNNQLRMIQYKNSPGKPDDTFHSILYCILASMLIKPRPDLLIPTSASDVSFEVYN